MASKHSYSCYSIAKKIIRHQSNISFLCTCKRLNLIPNELKATNVLANTTNSPLAESLALKHSRQWLQLSLDTQYYQPSKIRSYVFPMNYHEDKQLKKLQNSLKLTKSCKLQKLLKRKNTETASYNKQPQSFQNLSSEVLDRGLNVRVLNKGPSFVNAEPKNLPMFCLKARASLQSATDRLRPVLYVAFLSRRMQFKQWIIR